MADIYTQFSEIIENLTEPERGWWDKELSANELAYKDDGWYKLEDRGARNAVLDDNHDGTWNIWFNSETDDDFEALVNSIQRFLKAHRPKDCFVMSWAETCSKPRVAEFGGGAAFVTANETKWNFTQQWLHDKKQEFLGK